MLRASIIAAILVVVFGGIVLRRWQLRAVEEPAAGTSKWPPSPLWEYDRQRPGYYRLLVGMPLGSPEHWQRLAQISEESAALENGDRVRLADVTAYLITYPNGQLIDLAKPDGMKMPKWLFGLERRRREAPQVWSDVDFELGSRSLLVSFGPCSLKRESLDDYATSLKNLSDERIKVLRFGFAFPIAKGGDSNKQTWESTHYFDDEDFRMWYGLGEATWIEPRQTVADPNNYGPPPGLWVYECETEAGGLVLVAGKLDDKTP